MARSTWHGFIVAALSGLLITGTAMAEDGPIPERRVSLRADIDMQTNDAQSGDESSRTGSFLLQKRGEGDSRARVTLNKLIVEDDDKKKIIPEKIEYLLEGDWVVDRVYGRAHASKVINAAIKDYAANFTLT